MDISEKTRLTQPFKKEPSLAFSIITLTVLVAFIVTCISFFHIPIVTTLFFSWLLLVPFVIKLGYTTLDIENSVYEMIKIGVGLFALLLAIGSMIAVWIAAGTVPTLIYWGLELISPKYFLVISFIICMLVSMPIGTNWGTTSTAGVAMMGIGLGLGISPGLIAGSVVSGACVGNVLSPVADTPLLTSTISGVPLMRHIRHMIYTAVPAIIISCVLYTLLGLNQAHSSLDASATSSMLHAISSTFKLGIVTLIPLVVVIAMLVMRQSAVASIMMGCVIGSIIAVVYQGFSVTDIGSMLTDGVKIKTGSTFLDPILNRGGISSMLELIGVVVAALGMGGILKGSGILNKLIDSLSGLIKSRIGLTNTTLIGTGICSTLVAANYFSFIMNATLMTPLYKKFNYLPENASRAVSSYTDCISMMVPWSLNGSFIAATLGVPLTSIIPFMFFNITLVLLETIYGYLGLFMHKYPVSSDSDAPKSNIDKLAQE